jgi:hypothetical protein
VEPLLWFTSPGVTAEQPRILCWQKYNDLENVATLIEANKMKLPP